MKESSVDTDFIRTCRENYKHFILAQDFGLKSMKGPLLEETTPTGSDRIQPDPTESNQNRPNLLKIKTNLTESDQTQRYPTKSHQIPPNKIILP